MTRLVVFPAYRDNPFLDLMHCRLPEGADVVDTLEVEELLAAIAVDPARTVLHLNWTNPIAQRTRNPLTAARRAWNVVRALRAAKAEGLRIIWTVHNVLPHAARHARLERVLHRALAGLADRIHVMSSSTVEVAAPLYELPAARVVRIPHPSYFGAYGVRADRVAERELLGIGEHDLAVLMLGQMRSYKGVLSLLTAAGGARREHGRVVVLLAGNATPAEASAIEDVIRSAGVRCVRELAFIDAESVPGWLAAADVVALPYERVLNSGAMMLAATFARPVLLPNDPHVRREHGARPWVHWFDREAGGLRAALETLPVGDERAWAAAFADAGRWTPQDAGSAFARVVAAVRD